MKFALRYEKVVMEQDIPSLATEWKNRIKKNIEQKLIFYPEIFGKPLRRSLKGYRKLRVGDFRVVFRIEGQNVKIFAISHRSIVYKIVAKRI